MKRLQVILVAVILMLFWAESSYSITKVARVLNILEFYGGYSIPHGTYTELGTIPFVNDALGNLAEFDAGFLFDNTFTVGFNYGQLRSNHWMVLLGFRFTDININDKISFNQLNLDFRQYDVVLNVNFSPLDIQRDRFAPYVGIGFGVGYIVTEFRDFETGNDIKENDVTTVFGVNFGIDFKLYSPESGYSFVTLSSANSYEFVGDNNRPKHLTLGWALKYWFRL